MKLELAPLSIQLHRDKAILYVWTCTHDNKYDWRFPTLHESSKHSFTGWNEYDLYVFEHEVSYDPIYWTITPVRDIK